jgi:cytochrome c oxidase cbb3-type subunit 1
MHPYYIARAVGGLFFLVGTLVGCYNIWMTIRASRVAAVLEGDHPAPRPALETGS